MSKPWASMTHTERNGRATSTWKRVRLRVLAESGGICWLCGHPGADTVDHVRPLAEGGTNDPANLRAAHGPRRPEYGCPGNYGRKGSPAPRLSRDW
jgi:hypothetical protein